MQRASGIAVFGDSEWKQGQSMQDSNSEETIRRQWFQGFLLARLCFRGSGLGWDPESTPWA
jgi:hypothetical protein